MVYHISHRLPGSLSALICISTVFCVPFLLLFFLRQIDTEVIIHQPAKCVATVHCDECSSSVRTPEVAVAKKLVQEVCLLVSDYKLISKEIMSILQS